MDKTGQEQPDFVPLTVQLESYFSGNFELIPESVRERIERELPVLAAVWDKRNEEVRRKACANWDAGHDPALEPERQAAWDRVTKAQDIARQIRDLEIRNPLNITEVIEKEDRLKQLRSERDQLRRDASTATPASGVPADATAEPGGDASDGHAQQSRQQPVTSLAIRNAFRIPNVQDSDAWWRRRMGNAGRYKLIVARAIKGKGKIRSLWYPDRVAGWLVESGHLDSKRAASILRSHFPSCADAADLLFPLITLKSSESQH